jgi:carbamoyl-phosphate synthase large subunit
MINVFVTGCGGGVGQGIVKSLKLINDLPINIITADMSNLAAGLYFGNKSIIVPAANDKNYISAIIKILCDEKIDYYFPGTDVELVLCAKEKSFIESASNAVVVVSPPLVVEIANDKFKTYQFLKENGFYHPKTYFDVIPFEDLKYPVILKPRVGCRSIGVFQVYNESDLKKHLSNSSDQIVQELIGSDDTEYTCTIVVVDGHIFGPLILNRVLRSGDTFRAKPVKSEQIESYVKEVAIKLGVQGPCNFQLRIDKDGNPKIFEINSRFSGTTPFCAQLGFNPVEAFIKASKDIPYVAKIDYGLIVLRHWNEIILRDDQLIDFKNNRASLQENSSFSFI